MPDGALIADPARRRLVRAGEPGRWAMVSGVPARRLLPYVTGYQGYAETTFRPIRRRELPSPIVVLIVNFAASWEVGVAGEAHVAQERDSFVAGLDDVFTLVGATGPARCLQVDFTPIGAHRFFGVPMHLLSRRAFDARDVLGRTADLLVDRLHAASGWAARFAILDELIAERIGAAPPLARGIAWAWRRLVDTDGAVAIGSLSDAIGCSRKHLVASFHEEIGLAPKTVARVLRFNRALRRLEAGEAVGLAEIAQDCGYYDQAHFNRDFRAFAGITPTEWQALRLPEGGISAVAVDGAR